MKKFEELMIITMEECGELIQACSKAIRRKKYLNNESLKEELGDVLCMIDLMMENGIVTKRDLSNQTQYKKMKLAKWSNIIK